MPSLFGPKGDKGDTGPQGPSFSVTAPTEQSISSGTAFQPRAGDACAVVVKALLSSVLTVSAKVTISICSTQNGTYTDLYVMGLSLTLGVGVGDVCSGMIGIPSGWWVKATTVGTACTLGVLIWNL